jgi:hypothetical protein
MEDCPEEEEANPQRKIGVFAFHFHFLKARYVPD